MIAVYLVNRFWERQTCDKPKSGCPINVGLEVFGDRWTLLILRDVMFAERQTFLGDSASPEGISPKTLSERISMLLEEGILTRDADPDHSQRSILRLTEKGLDLVPLLADIAVWSLNHKQVDPALADVAKQRAEDRDAFLGREILRLPRPRSAEHDWQQALGLPVEVVSDAWKETELCERKEVAVSLPNAQGHRGESSLPCQNETRSILESTAAEPAMSRYSSASQSLAPQKGQARAKSALGQWMC